ARIDAGPILAQRRVAVSKDDNAGTLSKRLVAEGLPALGESLARLDACAVQVVSPHLEQGSYEPPVRQTALKWDQPFDHSDRVYVGGKGRCRRRSETRSWRSAGGRWGIPMRCARWRSSSFRKAPARGGNVTGLL